MTAPHPAELAAPPATCHYCWATAPIYRAAICRGCWRALPAVRAAWRRRETRHATYTETLAAALDAARDRYPRAEVRCDAST
jgi:hypothetical protein